MRSGTLAQGGEHVEPDARVVVRELTFAAFTAGHLGSWTKADSIVRFDDRQAIAE